VDSAPAVSTGSAAASAASSVSAPASAPTIVLPDVTSTPANEATTASATTTAAPVAASPEPRVERPAPTRTVSTRTTPDRTSRVQTVADDPTPAAPAQAPARPSSANILNDAPSAPVAAQNAVPAQTASPASTSAPANDAQGGFPTEAAAGLLALFGVGAAGYAALRSRRRRVAVDEYALTEEEVRHRADAESTDFAPGAVAATPSVPARSRAPEPATNAATAEERESLLDRMVDAAPDEANPFTSRKARRKRARLLMQQQGQAARQAAAAPFDWRSYRTETRPSTPATPDLVTA